jgi:hypothetical protein
LHGPATADVVVTPTNFLYCNGGAYALCFFSGPPEPTGKRREQGDNRALPCVLNGDIANCTCQVYTSGPYFVDINSILNLGAYYQTVQACGHEGARCANLFNCGPDGTKSGCATQSPAPVCQYVRDQNSSDVSVSLMPRADLLFAMDADYRIGQTNCTGLYAGRMTAPCFSLGDPKPPSDGDPIQCQCPTFTGPYQVGQSGQTCPIPSSDGINYVWSGANMVSGGDPKVEVADLANACDRPRPELGAETLRTQIDELAADEYRRADERLEVLRRSVYRDPRTPGDQRVAQRRPRIGTRDDLPSVQRAVPGALELRAREIPRLLLEDHRLGRRGGLRGRGDAG